MGYVATRFILSFAFLHVLLGSFKLNQAYKNAGTIDSNLAAYCKDSPKKVVHLMLQLEPVEEYYSLAKGIEVSKIKTHYIIATQKAQYALLKSLHGFKPAFKTTSYWIVNQIRVPDATCRAISAIASIKGVPPFYIKREEVFSLHSTSNTNTVSKAIKICANPTDMPVDPDPNGNIQWGVGIIGAPQVWPKTKGTGVVVATIDSGANVNHTNLKPNWREEFGWLDCYTNSSKGFPFDDAGHGSHTMGTLAGQNGMGVAPGAQWIAGKGCDGNGSCASSALLICAQWMICPYTRVPNGADWIVTQDCTKRPDVVSNSWGALPLTELVDNFFRDVTVMWREIGICGIFAIGNTDVTGKECFTTSSPGNLDTVTGVGATNVNDEIACFSSTGPAVFSSANKIELLKPDLCGPGVDITSAWNSSSTSTKTISGTSMATPHVAGAFALLYSAKKIFDSINLKTICQQIQVSLQNTAFQPTIAVGERTCNATALMGQFWPNNVYGYGIIEVDKAFNNLILAS